MIFSKYYIYIIATSLFLISLSEITKDLSIAIIAFCSIYFLLKGLTHISIMAFSHLSFLSILNPSYFGYPSSFFVLTKQLLSILLFFILFVQYRKLIFKIDIFRYHTLFMSGIFFLNLFFTNNTELYLASLLKIINFYCTTSFIIGSLSLSKQSQRVYKWIFSHFYLFIFLSIFLLIFFKSSSSISTLSGSLLFRGIYDYPNTIGNIYGPIIILLIAKIFSLGRSSSRNTLIILGLILVQLFFSGARGPFVSLAIAIFFIIIISVFSKKYYSEMKSILEKKYRELVFLVTTLFFIIILNLNFFTSFILKGTGSLNTADIFLASRGIWILKSFENFLDNFYFGIGFGVPTILEHNLIKYDPIFNLPISVPSEKAFIFTGLAEEFGIFGLTFFLFYFLKCFLYIKSNSGSIFNILLYIGIFCFSIFEYWYFSTGSIGGVNWLWIGACNDIAFNKKNKLY